MSDWNFILMALGVPFLFVSSAFLYLRPVLQSVLSELCGHPDRAKLWYRTAYLLALTSAIFLSLTASCNACDTPIVLQRLMGRTTLGVFFGVSIISLTLRGFVRAQKGEKA